MKRYRVQYKDRFVFIYDITECTTMLGEEIYIKLTNSHIKHLIGVDDGISVPKT